MDPQTPNLSTQTPETSAASPELPKKDSHGITIAAMAVFVLLALGAVAFLYYQNQQLKNLLAGYQTQTTPTPETTADPTVNWKTYSNATDGFSFKYPPTWALDTKGEKGDEMQENISVKLTKEKAGIGILANIVGIGGGPRNVPFEEINLWGKTYYKQYSDIDFATNTKRVDIADEPHGLGVFMVGTKTYMISLTYPATREGDKPESYLSQEFDQILSTFKFISPTASPSAKPVACTMEAKICPDGSSVGRVGPNCEFAPCP